MIVLALKHDNRYRVVYDADYSICVKKCSNIARISLVRHLAIVIKQSVGLWSRFCCILKRAIWSEIVEKLCLRVTCFR